MAKYYITYRGDSELKKVLLPILALVLAVGLALPVAAGTEFNPEVFDLIAGQHEDVGNVKVWSQKVSNDNGYLHVKYETTAGWVLKETHLAMATSLDDIPQTKKGNLIPGQFPYSTQHDPPVTEFTYKIPLDHWLPGLNGTLLCIAAHAVVSLQDGSQEETAWAKGSNEVRFTTKRGKRGNWATYFTYDVQQPGR